MSIALITGASTGLGSEFAKLFAKKGHSLVLVARRLDLLQELAKTIQQSFPVKVWCIRADLSEFNAGQKLFASVQELGLSVDILVNNAGCGSGGLFYNLPLNRELEMIDLNIRTLVETTHCFLPPMLKRRTGHILNVGSVAGFQPGPYMNTYSATKAFVNSFSEGLHEELRGTGVGCSVLAPGYTITEFQKSASISGMAGSFNKAHPAEVALDGYQAIKNGSAIKVAGFINFLGTLGVRLTPRFLVRKIAAQLNRLQV